MNHFLLKERWSPIVVGMGMGLLLVVLLNFGKQLAGCPGVNQMAALIIALVSQETFQNSLYFHQVMPQPTVLSWSLLFMIGIFFGSFLGKRLSKAEDDLGNAVWIDRFGKSNKKRFVWSFIGGLILILGNRIAGGCLACHGISGFSQFSIAGFVFLLSLFLTAIPTAFFLYKKTK